MGARDSAAVGTLVAVGATVTAAVGTLVAVGATVTAAVGTRVAVGATVTAAVGTRVAVGATVTAAVGVLVIETGATYVTVSCPELYNVLATQAPELNVRVFEIAPEQSAVE